LRTQIFRQFLRQFDELNRDKNDESSPEQGLRLFLRVALAMQGATKDAQGFGAGIQIFN